MFLLIIEPNIFTKRNFMNANTVQVAEQRPVAITLTYSVRWGSQGELFQAPAHAYLYITNSNVKSF